MKRATKPGGRRAGSAAFAAQVDKAIDRLMSESESQLPIGPRIAALVSIAADLHDLPRENFKEQLKRDLAARARSGASPATPEAEPYQRPGSIMPFMYHDDVVQAFEVYRKVFGATELHRVTRPDGQVSHIAIALGQTRVMLRDATTPDLAEYRARGFANTPRQLGGTPLHLYIYVADADAAFKRALDCGSMVVDPIGDKEWGDRCGGVRDPFGHIWYIATPLKVRAELSYGE